ncbi:EAL domain-containing protein [Persephonella sp. KM09-Lau-8]|uniref:EAL domain-containing response regulator n=1 Tax=Persephonella sp. KM09-Lau-8 TaxID=1158345 RepID=UPI00068FA25E|nr:EAL domain-containing protein [Persephonella sp. KM09-Lau-8]
MIPETEKIKVLYVEDDPRVRETTLLLLKEFFHKILTASNGNEGLKIYQKEKPDLIITDINMPVMSGLEMVSKIREKDKDIPIIVLTAHSETDYLIQSIKLGVDGYILKPIDLNQFLEVIKKVLEKITLKKELEKNIYLLKQYQKAVDELFIVSKTDSKGIITYVNKKFCDISKYSEEELIGKPHNIVRHPDVPKQFFDDLWKTIKEEKRKWKGIVKNKAKDGSTYYVDTIITPILDKEGNVVEFLSIRKDVSNIINPRKKLENMFITSENFLVAIINVDNFKYIENLLDFKSLQEIEEKIIKIIIQNIPEECNFNEVINVGDGEFVLAKELNEITNELIEKTIRNLKRVQKILQQVSREFIDYEIEVSISIAYGKNAYKIAKYGLSKISEINTDFIIANELEEKIKAEAKKNLKTLSLIKYAVENEGILLYLQPIVDNHTGNISKYEALVRIKDKDGNILSPFSFLDIAKKTKYYPEFTFSVMRQAFNVLEVIDTQISINLSVVDIEKEHIRNEILRLIENNKDKANKITFELLEEDVKDFSVIEDFIKTIKSFGIQIAIDDFGSGYSNFERLLDYQPDILKIDGSLVKNIENDKFSRNLVETIVSFAKKQNLQTIAEFVENDNIHRILKDIGVDFSQGYYFGKPQPYEDIIYKFIT